MKNKALFFSILIHGLLVSPFIYISLTEEKDDKKIFEFDLVEKKVQKVKKRPPVVINAKKPEPRKADEAQKPVNKVYGAKRKAITDKTGSVVVKKGNTLAKEEDDKVLKDTDPDTLPAPAEEYLITDMPKAIKEIRPEYPEWAKEKGLEGSVVFEVLIDSKGKVRQATLLRGLEPRLDALAKKAMMKFEFRPAKMEGETVAAKINYAIRYVLEN